MSSLNASAIAHIESLQGQAASVLLYQSVFKHEIAQGFLNLLQSLLEGRSLSCLEAYGIWVRSLATQMLNWSDYLIAQILIDENPFSLQAQRVDFAELPPALIAAAQHDLRALQQLYECSTQQISEWVQVVCGLEIAPVVWDCETHETLQEFSQTRQKITALLKQKNWADTLKELAAYYHECGSGLFAEYRALRWQSGQLLGIPDPDPVRLTQLVGYEFQRDTLIKNTEFLLAGYSALHVLLYGSRGSGKSSLVKAIVNEYCDRNLRLIEVAKSDLKDLAAIAQQLRHIPQKFIIFVDDLSFEDDDDAFKSLKVVLEGSATARPQNIVVYATSNRRHLIREFFADRPRPKDSDEVHAWDTVQEKLSFSDRFGLTLTFEAADQKTYLAIVQHLAAQAKIAIAPEDLEYRALQWATRHNGRSGRTARQFVDFLGAEFALND